MPPALPWCPRCFRYLLVITPLHTLAKATRAFFQIFISRTWWGFIIPHPPKLWLPFMLVCTQPLAMHQNYDSRVPIGGAWVAQSVKRPTSAQVTILRSVSSSPASGSGLMAQSLEPASDSVSPSLSAPPPLMLCLSLSQK